MFDCNVSVIVSTAINRFCNTFKININITAVRSHLWLWACNLQAKVKFGMGLVAEHTNYVLVHVRLLSG